MELIEITSAGLEPLSHMGEEGAVAMRKGHRWLQSEVASTMPTVLFCAFHFTAAKASQNSSYIHILEWRVWNMAAEGLL